MLHFTFPKFQMSVCLFVHNVQRTNVSVEVKWKEESEGKGPSQELEEIQHEQDEISC